MKLRSLIIPAILFVLVVAFAHADGDADFAKQLDLTPLRTIAVQHEQTIKTFDSYARQTLSAITGRSSLDGQDAVYTVMDMAIRPDQYIKRNLIKIVNVPLRKEFLRLPSISADEQERIVHDGTVSLSFWMQDDVQQLLQEASAHDTRRGDAINQANGSAMVLNELLGAVDHGGIFPPVAMVPPATDNDNDRIWHRFDEIAGNSAIWVEGLKHEGQKAPDPLPNYTAGEIDPVVNATVSLFRAWKDQNAGDAQTAETALVAALPAVNPSVYPSPAKRQVEVIYNHLANLTIPGAAFYFFAFVCFLMASRSGVAGLRMWGLRMFMLAFLIHSTGIAVRWWLVGSIPIKNEFESVMFSAWFGALVGLILELRSGRAIFGAGASFIGFLSLGAIFTVPYVFHKSIGENIGQVNGVLMSYWLYIHVTMVTASYSLIGMGFALSVWWLVKYYADYGTLSQTAGRQLSGEARGFDVVYPAGGTAALGLGSTLARMLFVPQPQITAEPISAEASAIPAENLARSFLVTLDACNLVVLQLAFWVLGTGIIFGAIWADQSWGRPWGWDPKETFALITWIVYLIVVHVRIATEDKAWWTAVLSIVGFFVMLFNWIGVNFFLSGLHSYA
jgi:cytochrome c-type biogenesis protein CcsB